MKISHAAMFAFVAMVAPAHAEGDAEAGEKLFTGCRACHAITDPDGNVIYKGGVNGPDLYGIVGRKIASVEGFRYAAGITTLAEAYPDAVWDVHSLGAYLADPSGYLRDHSGDARARSGMTYRLRRGQEDMVAYLLSHSPDAPAQPETSADGAPRP